MNNVTENQNKDRILKWLAVGGFVGLIIIIAWLSVKMVAYVPTAFSSLASLADSVYNYKPTTLTISSSKNVVNVDEPFTVTWNVPTQRGTFAFSHSCVEGVAFDMRSSDGSVQSMSCDTNYNLGTVDSIEIIPQSEKDRFVDVPYTIDFIPSREVAPTASSSSAVTIVNASISPIATSTDEEVEEPVDEETPEEVEEPTPTTPTTPVKPTTPTTPTTPRPTPQPEYIQEYIYGIPTSDPKGFTDLAATFVSVGTISNNNVFTAVTVIDNDARGAIQFQVKNIGTKTSESWNYVAKLPNGDTYTSPAQKALKPNERAIITLGFTVPSTTGTKNFSTAVTVKSDSKVANNSFTASVRIAD